MFFFFFKFIYLLYFWHSLPILRRPNPHVPQNLPWRHPLLSLGGRRQPCASSDAHGLTSCFFSPWQRGASPGGCCTSSGSNNLLPILALTRHRHPNQPVGVTSAAAGNTANRGLWSSRHWSYGLKPNAAVVGEYFFTLHHPGAHKCYI